LIAELSLATLMVLLTVVIHAIGLYAVARLLRLEEREEAAEHIHPLSARGFTVTLVVILSLIALHGVEIWLYAFLYDAIGAVHGLRNSVYFSTVTYGAIGYDDTAMAENWRLVSAIEGINGIILIGWSTAFFVTIVARMRRHR
jgi:amino acid transporter